MRPPSSPLRAAAVTAALTCTAAALPVSAASAAPARPYIVVLKDGSAPARSAGATRALIDRVHARIKGGDTGRYLFRSAVRGFAARLSATQVAKLAANPAVAYVAPDLPVKATADAVPTGIARISPGLAPLGLPGRRVGVAVVDTGIARHPDLVGNLASVGRSCVPGEADPYSDGAGHGTHVGGTVAAAANGNGVLGVNPSARLISVKVLDSKGSGSYSQIICGLDWVAANARTAGIEVVNMSLGGPGHSDGACGVANRDALHAAICRVRDAGVTIVVAAGNSTLPTTWAAPAAYDDAVITVSALADSDGAPGGSGPETKAGADDTFATFSNFGPEVDIAAPGVNIVSTSNTGGYVAYSGTSMASPHVAGAASRYLASHPGARWTEVRDVLAATGEPAGSGHKSSWLHPEPLLRVR